MLRIQFLLLKRLNFEFIVASSEIILQSLYKYFVCSSLQCWTYFELNANMLKYFGTLLLKTHCTQVSRPDACTCSKDGQQIKR